MKVPRQRRLAARRLLTKRGVRNPDAGNDTGHRRGFRAHLFCARRNAGEVCAIDVSSGLELLADQGPRRRVEAMVEGDMAVLVDPRLVPDHVAALSSDEHAERCRQQRYPCLAR